MASMNKLCLIGRLGADPTLNVTTTQKMVCNFNVAVSHVTMKNGQKEESTDWFQVSVWDKQAENCKKYLKKGNEVYVEGRVSIKEWIDKSGNKRSSLEVFATKVLFFGGAKDKETTTESQHFLNADAKVQSETRIAHQQNDDIPF